MIYQVLVQFCWHGYDWESIERVYNFKRLDFSILMKKLKYWTRGVLQVSHLYSILDQENVDQDGRVTWA